MSNILDKMSAPQIVQAIRSNDIRTIKLLVRDGVLNRKVWTQREVAEMLGVNPSTVSRWLNKNEN